MGAEQFRTRGNGSSAEEAFDRALYEAKYEHGHGGYSGTLAEKDTFTFIQLPEGISSDDFIDLLFSKNDPRIEDKWGPAGCVEEGPGKYVFFGYASS